MDLSIIFYARYGVACWFWLRTQRALYHVGTLDVYHPYCHSISVAHHQLSLCLGAASVAYISNDVPLWLEYRTNADLPLLSEEGRVKSEEFK